jgi:hypothetical protein
MLNLPCLLALNRLAQTHRSASLAKAQALALQARLLHPRQQNNREWNQTIAWTFVAICDGL